MLRDAFAIYRGFMNASSGLTGTAFNARLARADAVALFVVVEDCAPSRQSGTITVQFEHSGDAITWTAKAAVAEIDAEPLNPSGTTVASGGDNGTMPTLPHGRLRITTTAPSPTQLRVCLYVALRDVDPYFKPEDPEP